MLTSVGIWIWSRLNLVLRSQKLGAKQLIDDFANLLAIETGLRVIIGNDQSPAAIAIFVERLDVVRTVPIAFLVPARLIARVH